MHTRYITMHCMRVSVDSRGDCDCWQDTKTSRTRRRRGSVVEMADDAASGALGPAKGAHGVCQGKSMGLYEEFMAEHPRLDKPMSFNQVPEKPCMHACMHRMGIPVA
jgi:hypothetical protein